MNQSLLLVINWYADKKGYRKHSPNLHLALTCKAFAEVFLTCPIQAEFARIYCNSKNINKENMAWLHSMRKSDPADVIWFKSWQCWNVPVDSLMLCAMTAAENNDLPLLQSIMALDSSTPGQLGDCTWPLNKPSGPLFTSAARGGNLHILKWLVERGEKCQDMMAYVEAARKGHFHILNWLYDEVGLSPHVGAAKAAALKNRVDVLEWLEERKFPMDFADIGAAEGGHFELLRKYYKGNLSGASVNHIAGYSYFIQLNNPLFNSAVISGSLEILMWLYDQGCKDSPDCCVKAVIIDSLPILKWLKEIGHVWHADLLYCAAAYGRFEMIKLLHDDGYPLDEKILSDKWIYPEAKAYVRSIYSKK